MTRRKAGTVTTSSPSSPTSTHASLSWDDLETRRPHSLRFALFGTRKPSSTRANLTAALVAARDPHTCVTRLLDPEPRREPLVSLGAIFAWADVTIVDGLLRFGLRKENGDYDLTLAGYEPFDELWAPLALAKRIATDLGVDKQLASVLDWKTRHAWTLDEGESGLIHNWRVPADGLDSSSYSTSALLDVKFRNIELLSPGTQVRTLVSNAQRAQVLDATHRSHPTFTARRLDQNLLRLSVRAYEDFLEAVDTARATSSYSGAAHMSDEESVENDLTTPPPPDNEEDYEDWPTTFSKRTLLIVLRDILQRRPHCTLDNDGISLWEGRIRISATELLGAEPELGLSPQTSRAHRTRLVQARRQLAIAHLLTLTAWASRSGEIQEEAAAAAAQSASGDATIIASSDISQHQQEQMSERISSLEEAVKELSQSITSLINSRSPLGDGGLQRLAGLEKRSLGAGMDAISSGGSSTGGVRSEASGFKSSFAHPTSPFEVLIYLGIFSLVVWVLRFN